MMESRKVLVVDDEPDILVYLSSLLSTRFDVMLAGGGLEAMELIAAQRFDVVVTDVRMPEVDGLQLLETVKAVSPDTEVIFMSSFSDLDVVTKALNEGVFAYVKKPVVKEPLLVRINHAIAVVQARENQDRVLREMKNDLLMQTQFAQKLSALAAISGGIAHELHQPLSGISIYSATVKRMLEKGEGPEPAFLLETLNKIDAQVVRAIGVIEHMREFSSGGGTLEPTRLNLGAAVARVMELFNFQMQTHGIELMIAIPDTLEIMADRNHFEQVLINLMSNAKDSILEKSETPSSNTTREITIRGLTDEGRTALEICDTGKGIPGHLADTLFDPFVTSKKTRGGSGLGLFITRRLLEQSGGRIDLVSTGQGGSTFRVLFPTG